MDTWEKSGIVVAGTVIVDKIRHPGGMAQEGGTAVGRLTEDTDEDEEEQRKRIQGQEAGSAVGTALGLAIGALLAIRDEEIRKEEAALQEQLEEEQKHIW